MKLIYKLSITLIVFGLLFWFSETIYFQIIYGWHFEPINKAEQICDSISVASWNFGFTIFFARLIWDLVKHLEKIVQ
jgi:hypothetical protein